MCNILIIFVEAMGGSIAHISIVVSMVSFRPFSVPWSNPAAKLKTATARVMSLSMLITQRLINRPEASPFLALSCSSSPITLVVCARAPAEEVCKV